jgi:mono/diheme cytochrome c family protein
MLSGFRIKDVKRVSAAIVLWIVSGPGPGVSLAFGTEERGGSHMAPAVPEHTRDGPAAVDQNASAHPLVWDAMEKTIEPKPGDGAADFEFTVTNVSDKPVTIEQIRPSCGCTVAEMPSSPWIIAPGANGTFVGTIDFRGKEGVVSKSIFVNSTAGTQTLGIIVKIPTLDEEARKKNQMIAQQNRQAVFAGDCAKCHLEPIRERSGAELFTTACGVCHFSTRRSNIVPDLLTAREHRDAAFWRKWISEGKSGTLMPAWSKKNGGPLTDEQIESLVTFALQTLPTEPPAKE